VWIEALEIWTYRRMLSG